MGDPWDPDLYDRFRADRERPARELIARIEPVPRGTAVDLGCGAGVITRWLHERVRARLTVGIDRSPAMLERAHAQAGRGVEFHEGDLAEVDGAWDVVFANASLQWVPDHERLLPRLVGHLAPGGQIAFQVPANFDHPSHRIADELGREAGLEPLDRAIASRAPARYAEILWLAGIHEPDVWLRVYPVAFERTEQVMDWVRGTLLTRFEAALGPRFPDFLAAYRERLLHALGDPTGTRPYLYAFPRILAWGRRPGGRSRARA